MRLKKGVSIFGIRPELTIALMVCESVYRQYGQELIVTSLTEGKHSNTSDHYNGCAVDLRTNFFTPSEKKQVTDTLIEELGSDFYVLLEATHIHISYRPRGRCD